MTQNVPNIWNVPDLRPPAGQQSVAQTTFARQPDRFYPDNQFGFRVQQANYTLPFPSYLWQTEDTSLPLFHRESSDLLHFMSPTPTAYGITMGVDLADQRFIPVSETGFPLGRGLPIPDPATWNYDGINNPLIEIPNMSASYMDMAKQMYKEVSQLPPSENDAMDIDSEPSPSTSNEKKRSTFSSEANPLEEKNPTVSTPLNEKTTSSSSSSSSSSQALVKTGQQLLSNESKLDFSQANGISNYQQDFAKQFIPKPVWSSVVQPSFSLSPDQIRSLKRRDQSLLIQHGSNVASGALALADTGVQLGQLLLEQLPKSTPVADPLSDEAINTIQTREAFVSDSLTLNQISQQTNAVFGNYFEEEEKGNFTSQEKYDLGWAMLQTLAQVADANGINPNEALTPLPSSEAKKTYDAWDTYMKNATAIDAKEMERPEITRLQLYRYMATRLNGIVNANRLVMVNSKDQLEEKKESISVVEQMKRSTQQGIVNPSLFLINNFGRALPHWDELETFYPETIQELKKDLAYLQDNIKKKEDIPRKYAQLLMYNTFTRQEDRNGLRAYIDFPKDLTDQDLQLLGKIAYNVLLLGLGADPLFLEDVQTTADRQRLSQLLSDFNEDVGKRSNNGSWQPYTEQEKHFWQQKFSFLPNVQNYVVTNFLNKSA